MVDDRTKKAFLGTIKETSNPDKIIESIKENLRKSNKLDDKILLQINEIEKSLRQAPVSNETNEASPFSIKSLNILTDKMARGLCKKIFLSGSKENKSFPLIAKEITKTLKEKDLMGDEVKSVIKEMIMSQSAPPKKENTNLFDIKALNFIEDKMVRGLAKKIYVLGKKQNQESATIVENIINELKNNEKLDDSLESSLKGLI